MTVEILSTDTPDRPSPTLEKRPSTEHRDAAIRPVFMDF